MKLILIDGLFVGILVRLHRLDKGIVAGRFCIVDGVLLISILYYKFINSRQVYKIITMVYR